MSETANAVDARAPELAHLSDAINRKRIENAHAWFKAWIDADQREFTSAARTLELGENGRPLLSKFYHRKLEADPTRIVLAIEALRAQLEGPEGVSAYIGFRETRCARLIFKHAAVARDGHTIGLLIGSMGFGKTEAIREFCRRVDGDGKPPVEYFYCRISVNLPALIAEIAERLGIIGRDKSGDPARLHARIEQRLKSHPRFLILDEADALPRRCIEFLRNVNDNAGTGVLLIGRPALLSTIRSGISWTALNDQDKERIVNDGPLAPFVDRVSFAALPGVSENEAVDIAEDVLKARFNEEAISKLLSYCGSNFRLLAKLIGKLRDIRVRAGAKIDGSMIEAAWLKLQYLDLGAPRK